jgi:hypothetical protein
MIDMANLSLGQKAVILGIMGIIAVLAIAVFVIADILGKALALLVLGVTLSSAYKILYM